MRHDDGHRQVAHTLPLQTSGFGEWIEAFRVPVGGKNCASTYELTGFGSAGDLIKDFLVQYAFGGGGVEFQRKKHVGCVASI